MEEQIVSFKVAKLAKEKVFNEVCNYIYSTTNLSNKPFIKVKGEREVFRNSELQNSKIDSDEGTFYDIEYSAPTQSLLQRWLREIHKISVCVNNFEGEDYKLSIYCYYGKEGRSLLSWRLRYPKSNQDYTRYKTFEEALEEGLKEALNLI